MSDTPSRSRPAAAWLALSLLASLALAGLAGGRGPEPGVDDASAGAWRRQATELWERGDTAAAIEACRAGLVVEPWNAALCRDLTLLHLERGEPEPLRLWMDDLVMGDARQAEQLFDLPEFEPWLERPDFQRLQREAVSQARD